MKNGDCEIPSDVVDRLDFAVVPAVMSVTKEVGSSRIRLRFSEDPNLYQLAVYYHVYNALIKGNYTEVYLDITHGINYMPHLASEAVRLAAYVYAVRNRKNVSLVTVNSDPYSVSRSQSPGGKQQVGEVSREVPDLTIHRTYDEKVIRWNAPNVAYSTMFINTQMPTDPATGEILDISSVGMVEWCSPLSPMQT